MTPELRIRFVDGIALKQVAFQDIGWNVPFMVDDSFTPTYWAVRIDDSRFIRIGQNGALFPEKGMRLYVR